MITITNRPEGTIINAYNNCIIQFTATDTPSRTTIEANGITFQITPISGKFYFNLKDIVTVLINQNKFIDTVAPDSAINYLFADTTLYLELTANITVLKANGSNETTSLDFKFLKSVQQDIRPRYDESDTLRILNPTDNVNRTVSYFEGYPFDLSIYSDTAREVTVRNQRNGIEKTLNLFKGVNRLFISNGENDNLGFENDVPLLLGLNELQFSYGTQTLKCYVDKKPVDCGPYLKWFNQSGGWSYWLFDPIYQVRLGHKTTLTLNNDTTNLAQTSSRIIVAGKESQKEYTIDTGWMDDIRRLQLEQIFSSPKVYLYSNRELQPFQLNDWKEVDVKSGTATIENSKRSISRYQINIKLPNQYSQNYAN